MMRLPQLDTSPRGRGTGDNPRNRFMPLDVVVDADVDCPPDPGTPRTVYLRDPTRTIIAHNDSPDVGFDYSVNPYRGCEHGCIYCSAAPFRACAAPF